MGRDNEGARQLKVLGALTFTVFLHTMTSSLLWHLVKFIFFLLAKFRQYKNVIVPANRQKKEELRGKKEKANSLFQSFTAATIGTAKKL